MTGGRRKRRVFLKLGLALGSVTGRLLTPPSQVSAQAARADLRLHSGAASSGTVSLPPEQQSGSKGRFRTTGGPLSKLFVETFRGTGFCKSLCPPGCSMPSLHVVKPGNCAVTLALCSPVDVGVCAQVSFHEDCPKAPRGLRSRPARGQPPQFGQRCPLPGEHASHDT